MADGYFSASHRKSAGISDFESPLDHVFYEKPDDSLAVSATSSGTAECSSKFIAASANAATNKRNDITGIFGGVCRHGTFDMFFGEFKKWIGFYKTKLTQT